VCIVRELGLVYLVSWYMGGSFRWCLLAWYVEAIFRRELLVLGSVAGGEGCGKGVCGIDQSVNFLCLSRHSAEICDEGVVY